MPLSFSSYYRSNLPLIFFITLLGFVFSYIFFGFYYVEYEGLTTSFFSGKLTPGLPFRSLYFSGNIGISYLYSFLYETCPNIEWLSWIEYAYLFLSCFIGLYLVAAMLPDNTSLLVKIILQLVVYFLVFADHHIHLLYTRVAFMCCGLSLIGLVMLFNSPASVKSRLKLFLLLNLFFTIGTLTRNEAAIACFLLLLFWAVFYLQNIKQVIRLFLYPFLLISTISLFLAVDIKTATPREFFKQVEPDIEEQFIGRGNLTPISSMKTHRDSVIFSAAEDVMWPDPKVISPEYLRSLILPEKFMFTDGRQWNRVCREISEIAKRYWYLLLTCIGLSLALFVQYDFQGPAIKLLCWLAFELSFFGLTLAQTYVDKVNDRSFMPLLSLFIFCNVLLLIRNLRPPLSGWLYPILSFCFILFAIHFYYLKTESNTLQKDLSKYQSNLEKIKKTAMDKFLAVNSTSFDYLFLSNVPFHTFDFSAFKKIYITDGYIIPFLPYYKRYLEKECNCDIYAFPSFWNYLRSIQQEVVIVSNPHRMKVMQDYLLEIYRDTLPVIEENSTQLMELRKSDNRDNPDELKVFVFEK